MVGMKITCPRDGRHKNNSPKGWMGGELHGLHENISPKTGELNSRHGNNSPKDGESNSKITKITRPRVGQYKNNSPKG